MKVGKKLLVGSLSLMMVVSNLNIVHAKTPNSTGRNLKQVSLETIEKMPNIPSQYHFIDWLQRGKDLNDFIFDYTATNFNEKTEFSVKGDRTFSTIYRDDRYGGYKMPAFYGENRPLVDHPDKDHYGSDDQESIVVTSALLAASLMGIDMNKELPEQLKGTVAQEIKDQDPNMLNIKIDTYLDNALKFFWTVDGTNIFTNVPNGSMSELQNMPGAYQAFDDFWYMLIANQNFYRLVSLNPNWKPEMVNDLQKKTADKMCQMVDILGNGNPANCDFNIQGFNFKDMKLVKPVGQGRRQPDGAVGTASILYDAYKIFKDTHPDDAQKYLEYAKYCMGYLDKLTANPYYENMLIDAVYLSTMMNAEQGTNYDTSKYIKWITTTSSSSVRNWGGVNYSQDGIDAYGLTGEPNNGYSYFFNSIYPMTSILPAAKYDPSYARMAGKWAINIANSSKYFLPDQWSKEHQTDGNYIGKKEGGVMAYESLRKSGNNQNFFATGDAKQNATSGWMAGENTTNFGLYGSVYTGFLGALAKETNVEGILQLDCNKTDYYQDSMYQTYLYYNPYMESKDVEIDLGNKHYDLYDSTTGSYLAKNVTGKQTFKLLADSARVIVLADANSTVEYDGHTTKINGKLVASSAAEVLEDEGTELITNVSIAGQSTITKRGQTEKYTAVLTPSSNIMDPRIIWSVTDGNGQETDKAVITKDGQLTVKKNGTVKVKAMTIDGSGKSAEKIVQIGGQTLASLSQDKPTTTSSVNGGHGGNLAVDGDSTTRWIASGENNPWIYVDLGAEANIDLLILNWETARPPKYVIEVSDDAQNWTEIVKVEDEGNSEKVARFELDEVKTGRYVRIYANQRSNYGCSLREFDVYGNYKSIDTPVTQIDVSSANNVDKITTKNRPLQMSATINPNNATDKRVEWIVTDVNGNDTALAEITSSGKLTPLGNGVIKVVAKAADGSNIKGQKTITLENQDKDNLALGKKGFVSHSEGANPKEDAFDDNIETRWASGSTDKNQWITVDLGDVYSVNKVVLYWEASFAQEYKIQGSMDNEKFDDLYVENDGKGGVEEKTFTGKPFRYVRMQNVKLATNYGCSLWEFQVYGDKYAKTYVEKIDITSESSKNEITVKNKPLQLSAKITPDNATESRVEWTICDKDGQDTEIATITKDGKVVPKENGTVKVIAKAIDGSDVQAEALVTITGQDAPNIALGKDVSATSEGGGNKPSYVNDGKMSSRWASSENDNQSITIDLKEPYYIHQVALHWEGAYGKEYQIKVSLDGQNFTTVHDQKDGKGSLENAYFDETLVRYVKMQGIKRATNYGYSIYEFEVYGKAMKEDLKLLYETVKDTKEALYTPKSYSTFKTYLNTASQIIDKVDATEAEVKDIKAKLDTAYKALIIRANTELLQKVIKDAEKELTKDYTEKSLKELQVALTKAKNIYDDKNSTQKAVDDVQKVLEEAIKGLVVKPEDPKPVDPTPEQPSTEDKVVSNKDQSVTISGRLPKDVTLSSNVLTSSQIKVLEEKISKAHPEFFTTAKLEKVFDLKLMLKDVVYNLDGSVKVKLKLDKDIKNVGIIYIDDNGHITKLDSIVGNGYIEFSTNHFSTYAIVSYTSKEEEGVSKPGEVETPKTDDSIKIMPYIAFMTLATAAYIIIKKKKEEI